MFLQSLWGPVLFLWCNNSLFALRYPFHSSSFGMQKPYLESAPDLLLSQLKKAQRNSRYLSRNSFWAFRFGQINEFINLWFQLGCENPEVEAESLYWRLCSLYLNLFNSCLIFMLGILILQNIFFSFLSFFKWDIYYLIWNHSFLFTISCHQWWICFPLHDKTDVWLQSMWKA